MTNTLAEATTPATSGVLDVVALPGSLRSSSFNRALLDAAVELAPVGMAVEIHELGALPVYDADLDDQAGAPGPAPQPVTALRERVSRSDAVILGTVEHNWGPSAALKNAVDWLSRPAASNPLRGKPVALMGTSPGPAGTGRAQLQVRQYLLFLEALALPGPHVQLGGAAELFARAAGGQLMLLDPAARAAVRAQLNALQQWTTRVGGLTLG